MSDDKTEEPTPKKLQDARKKGQTFSMMFFMENVCLAFSIGFSFLSSGLSGSKASSGPT